MHGTGGSGVNTVKSVGHRIGQIVGPQFDVVGFDPRGECDTDHTSSSCSQQHGMFLGVSRSTPRVSFFESLVERELWDLSVLSVSLNATADGVAREWARAQVTGRLAGERDRGVLSHINTDHTARDMLRIVEAHGQEKLQYWGFSCDLISMIPMKSMMTVVNFRYGTVLGATFAAMFPVGALMARNSGFIYFCDRTRLNAL